MDVTTTLNGQDYDWVPTTYRDVGVDQEVYVKYTPRGKANRRGKEWNRMGKVEVKEKGVIIVSGTPIEKDCINEILIKKGTTNLKVPYTPKDAWHKIVRYLVQNSPCKAQELSNSVGRSPNPSTIGLYLRKNPHVKNTEEGWIVLDPYALLNDGIE